MIAVPAGASAVTIDYGHQGHDTTQPVSTCWSYVITFLFVIRKVCKALQRVDRCPCNLFGWDLGMRERSYMSLPISICPGLRLYTYHLCLLSQPPSLNSIVETATPSLYSLSANSPTPKICLMIGVSLSLQKIKISSLERVGIRERSTDEREVDNIDRASNRDWPLELWSGAERRAASPLATKSPRWIQATVDTKEQKHPISV